MDKRMHGMSKEEILDFFKSLGYQDEHGHELTLCVDFIELVEMAVKRK